MIFPLVLFFSAAIGFISLSQEILWVRIITYSTGGAPEIFAYILGFFLIGLSLGSLFGKWATEKKDMEPAFFVGATLIVASIFYFFSLPIFAFFQQSITSFNSPVSSQGVFYFLVVLLAFLTGGIFPLLCHLGVDTEENLGGKISYIYMANIVGATSGPLITGFYLLDKFNIETNILIITYLTLVTSFTAFFFSKNISKKTKNILSGILILVFIFCSLSYDKLYERILEKFHGNSSYKSLLQNRSGVIAVIENSTGDIVLGGGIYDGTFNVDPVVNSNIITRGYMFAALHKNPETVLEIGLSTGSWTQIMANHEKVRSITAVEINPGYKELISNYPVVASILTNPKVEIVVDDGRRWLNRNPDKKFDFILSNTTFHWRSHATNLLSVEFFKIIKKHLKPGGVVYLNTTGSYDVHCTAAHVFKYVTFYANFVAASDSPFDLTKKEMRENLLGFKENGKSIFEKSDQHKNLLEKLSSYEFIKIGKYLRQTKDLVVITDNNMATEYKKYIRKNFGRPDGKVFDSNKSWLNIFTGTRNTEPRDKYRLRKVWGEQKATH